MPRINSSSKYNQTQSLENDKNQWHYYNVYGQWKNVLPKSEENKKLYRSSTTMLPWLIKWCLIICFYFANWETFLLATEASISTISSPDLLQSVPLICKSDKNFYLINRKYIWANSFICLGTSGGINKPCYKLS